MLLKILAGVVFSTGTYVNTLIVFVKKWQTIVSTRLKNSVREVRELSVLLSGVVGRVSSPVALIHVQSLGLIVADKYRAQQYKGVWVLSTGGRWVSGDLLPTQYLPWGDALHEESASRGL